MTSRVRIASIASFVVTTLFPLATAAHAEWRPQTVRENPDGSRSVRVTYADLNLGTKAGRDALDRRMRRAYDQVCPYDAFRVDELKSYLRCRRVAVASATEQVASAIARHRAVQLAAAGNGR